MSQANLDMGGGGGDPPDSAIDQTEKTTLEKLLGDRGPHPMAPKANQRSSPNPAVTGRRETKDIFRKQFDEERGGGFADHLLGVPDEGANTLTEGLKAGPEKAADAAQDAADKAGDAAGLDLSGIEAALQKLFLGAGALAGFIILLITVYVFGQLFEVNL